MLFGKEKSEKSYWNAEQRKVKFLFENTRSPVNKLHRELRRWLSNSSPYVHSSKFAIRKTDSINFAFPSQRRLQPGQIVKCTMRPSLCNRIKR